MQYKAINDSVIVQFPELEKETQRESGIFLIQADANAGKTVIGTVTSVGEGKFDPITGTYLTPTVSIGDRIITNATIGILLDSRHRMIRIDDIFAVITD